MNKEYIFNDPTMGGKTIIRLTDGLMTISRPGIMSKFLHGFSGEKTIMFNQISAIQIKKAGIARGYIQFVVLGTKEAKSGAIFGNSKDENIVYFASTFNNKKNNEAAEEIKNIIEQYNVSCVKGTTVIQNIKSPIEQVKDLKELLDIGAITQEEYDKKKKELLNL